MSWRCCPSSWRSSRSRPSTRQMPSGRRGIMDTFSLLPETTTRPENSEQNRTEVQQTLPLSLIAQLQLFHPSSSNHCHFHLSNYHPHNQVRANSRKSLNNFNLERFYYLICSFPISNNIKAQISQFMKKVWMSFQKCIAAKLR